LIDINGDGLPDRVFDRNPKTDQQGFFVYQSIIQRCVQGLSRKLLLYRAVRRVSLEKYNTELYTG
jgi:hypothetical protein